MTVLLPVYNAAPYLGAALDSILGQTFREFECLVIDDGSEDESRDKVRQYADPRVHLVCRPHSGLGASLEYGIRACTTPLLARMDADDYSSPGRLARQVAYLESNAQVGAVGTQFSYFGGSRVMVPSPQLPLRHDRIRSELRKGNLALCHASLMMRTDVLLAAGGYRVKGIGEDWDMFLRLTERTRVANLEDVLYYWRVHPGNIRYANTFTNLLGIEYAKRCAHLRDRGLPETDFDVFVRERRRHLRVTASDALKTLALVQYRQALGEFAESKRLLGGCRMAIASALAPRRAARRIWQIARNRLHQSSPL